MTAVSKNLPDKLKEKFDQVYWSIYLLNTTLTELQIITDYFYSKDELSIANSHTFNLYKMTLQYCIIMEYTKLLQGIDEKRKNSHISSLFKLNQTVFDYTKSFESKFVANKEKLDKLKNSIFGKHIRDLRDKKFAHSDSHEVNSPFNIKGFQSKDFEEGFCHLSIMKEILIECSSEFNFEYSLQIPAVDKRTENFIRYHSKYKDYYFKNLLK